MDQSVMTLVVSDFDMMTLRENIEINYDIVGTNVILIIYGFRFNQK